jgi:hypothetical protein
MNFIFDIAWQTKGKISSFQSSSSSNGSSIFRLVIGLLRQVLQNVLFLTFQPIAPHPWKEWIGTDTYFSTRLFYSRHFQHGAINLIFDGALKRRGQVQIGKLVRFGMFVAQYRQFMKARRRWYASRMKSPRAIQTTLENDTNSQRLPLQDKQAQAQGQAGTRTGTHTYTWTTVELLTNSRFSVLH